MTPKLSLSSTSVPPIAQVPAPFFTVQLSPLPESRTVPSVLSVAPALTKSGTLPFVVTSQASVSVPFPAGIQTPRFWSPFPAP